MMVYAVVCLTPQSSMTMLASEHGDNICISIPAGKAVPEGPGSHEAGRYPGTLPRLPAGSYAE